MSRGHHDDRGPLGDPGGRLAAPDDGPRRQPPCLRWPPPSRQQGPGHQAGALVGLRPWADVGQEVPEAGHGSWTRSRRRPTATGDSHDTPLTRGAPTRRSRFPLVHGAAGRGGRGPAQASPVPGLTCAWHSGWPQDSTLRDVHTSRARLPASAASGGRSSMSRCVAPSEAVRKLTRCRGQAGWHASPTGTSPGPRGHAGPTPPCLAVRLTEATAELRLHSAGLRHTVTD